MLLPRLMVQLKFAMKLSRQLAGSLIAACVFTLAAFGGEVSPSGHWKWTVQGRQGGQGFDQELTLVVKDGKLSGVMKGRKAGSYSVPDTPITDVTFKDGQVSFSLTRELNGQKFTTKYIGKVEGDAIKGSFERSGVPEAMAKSDWNATRLKQ